MERHIAALLNSSRFGNIFDKEEEGINDVITEYFTTAVSKPDSDSEEESDGDENELKAGAMELEDMIINEKDSSFISDEETDEPVVRVEELEGGKECIDCNGALGKLVQQAEQFSCNCQFKGVEVVEGDKRRGCIRQFSPKELTSINLSLQEMDRGARDLLILGLISSSIRIGPTTDCSKRKSQKERQRSRSCYSYMGRQVCTAAFRWILGRMSKDRLQSLQDHFKENGLVPRRLKSGGRKCNTASLSIADTERIKHFITQYAEDHAVSLPGRVPGFKRSDIQLLPSSHPKSRVYRSYAESADRAGHRKVAVSTFRTLWLQLCPYVVVARPMTDLCWKCQANNTKIFRSANLTLEEKSDLIQEQQSHLSQVDAERQHYRNLVQDSKDTVRRNGLHKLQRTLPNSRNIALHYSFDLAHQVHYPSNAAQPGPLYFLTPRKCAIFGICCEGLPQQINYLIDESVNTSKGSNGVISYTTQNKLRATVTNAL